MVKCFSEGNHGEPVAPSQSERRHHVKHEIKLDLVVFHDAA